MTVIAQRAMIACWRLTAKAKFPVGPFCRTGPGSPNGSANGAKAPFSNGTYFATVV